MALPGATATETTGELIDDKAMTAIALLVVSTRLVAVTLTFWALFIVAGAVYRPLAEIVPT